MNAPSSFATNHPVILVLGLTVTWFILLMVFMGIASSVLRKPYGDAITTIIGQLAATACILLLIQRLDWLAASGIARLGHWQIWLLALVGLFYFVGASLYAFYGNVLPDKVAFDASSLIHSPASRTTVLMNFMAGLSEETLFRGVVLYALVRVWGHTEAGMIGSVALAALLFAVLYITQVFTHGVSRSAALWLTLETFVIAMWWGALVLTGGSVWPAVLLHFVVNTVVAVQGLTVSMVEPPVLAYRRILWFSLPLGVLGVGLLILATPHPIMPNAS